MLQKLVIFTKGGIVLFNQTVCMKRERVMGVIKLKEEMEDKGMK